MPDQITRQFFTFTPNTAIACVGICRYNARPKRSGKTESILPVTDDVKEVLLEPGFSGPYTNEENTVSQMKKLFGMLLVSALVSGTAIANDEIQARIAPVGSVCMSGDDCAAAPAPVAAAGPKSGKDVYVGFCTTCHGAGVMGAPKYGTPADWAPRLSKGIDTLYTHAISGFNAMPAKGMCAACSEDEVKAAVDYMLEGSK